MSQINLYRISYWSSVDWALTEMHMLAESEEQVRKYVDNIGSAKPEFRIRSYSEDGVDSLKIEFYNEVKLPIELGDLPCH